MSAVNAVTEISNVAPSTKHCTISDSTGATVIAGERGGRELSERSWLEYNTLDVDFHSTTVAHNEAINIQKMNSIKLD